MPGFLLASGFRINAYARNKFVCDPDGRHVVEYTMSGINGAYHHSTAYGEWSAVSIYNSGDRYNVTIDIFETYNLPCPKN